MIGSTTLPDTDLRISRLSFGTASLHHLRSTVQRQELLMTALDAGVTHFDSSPYYGFGLAEEELGVLERARRGAATFATKVGLYPPGGVCPGTVAVWARKAAGKVFPKMSRPVVNWSVVVAERSLERSLRRLKTDRVDILFLHEPDPALLDAEEFLSWLRRQQGLGKIRCWGLAGNIGPMMPLIRVRHPIGLVLQVKDSLKGREADPIVLADRALQITYGYHHSREPAVDAGSRGGVLAEALKRNRTGSVLFSTRRIERIAGLRDDPEMAP